MSELQNKFSSFAIDQVRENIRRIIMSYRNSWDIYSELFQNSIDALIDNFSFSDIDKGSISLHIDTIKREIIIEDNGIGISPDNLSSILVLGESLKRRNNSGRYGFMGYGFSFIAFQSEYLKIESTHDGKLASRTYENLYKFVFAQENLPISYEEENNIDPYDTSNPNGTKITLKFPTNFPDETIENTLKIAFDFILNQDLLEYILRTKTAIGIVDPLFEDKKLFDLNITINTNKIDIKPGYLTNKEILEKLYGTLSHYSIDAYNSFISQTEHLDNAAKKVARKTHLIYGIYKNLSVGTTNPLTIDLYICSNSKTHLNELTKKFSLLHNKENLSAENGVWLAINGLPTGICLDTFDHPSYLPFTIIVNAKDQSIRNELDSGRKGITQYRALQIVDKVKQLLKDYNFILYREYVISSDTRITTFDYNPREVLNNKYTEKTDYNIQLKNKYLPPKSEQDIISLFIELISTNILLGYYPKVLSSSDVYDCLCLYKCDFSSEFINTENCLSINPTLKNANNSIEKNIVIEFKHTLKQIFSDVKNIKKNLQDIDIIVCWDVEFEKSSEFVESNGVLIKLVDKTSNIFFGITHEIIGLGQNTRFLPIIELKTIINSHFNLSL